MTQPTSFPREQGSVLIIALVILLVLTLLGVAGMSSTALQEHMARNSQDVNGAFQAAEAGLRDGERDVSLNITSATVFYADCSFGHCEPALASTGLDDWSDPSKVNWVTGYHTILYGTKTGQPPIPGVKKQPRYIIEELPTPPRGNSIVHGRYAYPPGLWFRVTAVGFGKYGHAEAMVQSVIRK